MSLHVVPPRPERITPDLPDEPRQAYRRESFRVDDRVFTRVEPGEYRCGRITVYCDQQDSTSWAARVGAIHTGYFWFPEYAVCKLLDSVEAL